MDSLSPRSLPTRWVFLSASSPPGLSAILIVCRTSAQRSVCLSSLRFARKSSRETSSGSVATLCGQYRISTHTSNYSTLAIIVNLFFYVCVSLSSELDSSYSIKSTRKVNTKGGCFGPLRVKTRTVPGEPYSRTGGYSHG